MATLEQGIRRLGFRKWYERQLIDAHLSLVTCVLCMVLIAALLEDLEFDQGIAKTAAELATAFAAGALAWFAWQRYVSVIGHAEYYAGQSVCGACQTYARFEVIDAADDGDTWVRIRCRKCANDWLMH